MDDLYKKIISSLTKNEGNLKYSDSPATVYIPKKKLEQFKKLWKALSHIPIELKYEMTSMYISALQENTVIYLQNMCLQESLDNDLSTSQLALLCKGHKDCISKFNQVDQSTIIKALVGTLKNGSSASSKLVSLYLLNEVRPHVIKNKALVDTIDRLLRKTKMSIADTTTATQHSKYINLIVKNYMPELDSSYLMYVALNDIEPCTITLNHLSALVILQKEEVKPICALPLLEFEDLSF